MKGKTAITSNPLFKLLGALAPMIPLAFALINQAYDPLHGINDAAIGLITISLFISNLLAYSFLLCFHERKRYLIVPIMVSFVTLWYLSSILNTIALAFNFR